MSESKLDSNNPNFKGYIITPAGVFESSRLAAIPNNVSNVTVINRCKSIKHPDWYISTELSKETPV